MKVGQIATTGFAAMSKFATGFATAVDELGVAYAQFAPVLPAAASWEMNPVRDLFATPSNPEDWGDKPRVTLTCPA